MSTRVAPVTHGVTPCSSWRQLVESVAAFFTAPSDPFVTDMLVVPSSGHGRHIAQFLSRHLGATDGVCAGITFVTPEQLTKRLLSDDPWTGTSFSVSVGDALGGTTDQLFAFHTAMLMDGYRHQCPAMLQAWCEGNDIGPDGAPLPPTLTWQPKLWRTLQQRLGPWPLPTCENLTPGLMNSGGRLAGVLVTPPSPRERPLVDALMQCGAPVWVLRQVSDESWTRYSATWPSDWPRGETPDFNAHTLLASVQTQLAGGLVTGERVADSSLQIHASHGPNRQVQVLRDVLCSVFDELPDLQPREVLVLCTDLDRYSPLLEASFAASSNHPASTLRLATPKQQENWLITGLIDVLSLADQRATADDLLRWCGRLGVAQHFEFTPDDLERLEDLISQAGVVWGIDGTQRAQAGVQTRDGTWLDGVQRLLLALASDDVLQHNASTVPVAGVRSEDADLIGALAELVSRLRRALIETSTPAPLRHWADRLQLIATDLFAPRAGAIWCWERLNDMLSKWRSHPSDFALTSGDVSAILLFMTSRWGRSADGSGNLMVRQLGDLRGVDFRVICVLGLDDEHFPGHVEATSDDLLHGAVDYARQINRTALRDALMATRDSFIVVTQGADERTGANLPAPVAITDLLALCGVRGPEGSWQPGRRDGVSLVRRHTLQSYGWAAFSVEGERAPISYDARALLSARALARPQPKPTLPPWHSFVQHAGESLPDSLTLDDIESFLANPARFLLRQACGLSLADTATPTDGQLSDELDSLGRWVIGQTLFDCILSGVSPVEARERALATPGCPPGRLGVRGVDPLVSQAVDLAATVKSLGALDDVVAIDLTLDGVRLTGAVPLYGSANAPGGGSVIVSRFGRLKPLQLITCWVRLLAVAASRDAQQDTLVGYAIALSGRRELQAPPAAKARDILAQITALTRRASRELIPLPIETSAAWAGVFGNPVTAADEAFSGRFGEGKHPAWELLLGDTSLSALQRVGPPSFTELSEWLWRPIIGGAA